MRFGHHPDAATDFCVEVDELVAMNFNRKHGIGPEPSFEDRHFVAMQFRVGGDLNAVAAKDVLRSLAA